MRLRRGILMAGLALLAGFSACGPTFPSGTQYTDARFMDQVCKKGGCQLQGSARSAAGITADAVGFEIGPGPGAVFFQIPPDQGAGASVSADVLVEGSGNTTTDVLSEEYAWRAAAVTLANDGSASVSVTIADQSHARIADLRIVRAFSSSGCD